MSRETAGEGSAWNSSPHLMIGLGTCERRLGQKYYFFYSTLLSEKRILQGIIHPKIQKFPLSLWPSSCRISVISFYLLLFSFLTCKLSLSCSLVVSNFILPAKLFMIRILGSMIKRSRDEGPTSPCPSLRRLARSLRGTWKCPRTQCENHQAGSQGPSLALRHYNLWVRTLNSVSYFLLDSTENDSIL